MQLSDLLEQKCQRVLRRQGCLVLPKFAGALTLHPGHAERVVLPFLGTSFSETIRFTSAIAGPMARHAQTWEATV
jgi:hypothetical protein